MDYRRQASGDSRQEELKRGAGGSSGWLPSWEGLGVG